MSSALTAAQPQSAEMPDAAVAARAYSYWLARGCQGGEADDDWYRAVQELTAERRPHDAH